MSGKTRKSSKKFVAARSATQKSSQNADHKMKIAVGAMFGIAYQTAASAGCDAWQKSFDAAKAAGCNARKPSRKSIARIFNRFAATKEAKHLSADAIKQDASHIAECGQRARTALANGRSVYSTLRKASKIADRYGADIVDNRDLVGMVLGLEFRSERADILGCRGCLFVA